MEVSEYFLKISQSNIPIDKDLEMDQDYELHITGQIVKIEDKSNEDGTVKRIYTIKPYLVNDYDTETKE